VTIKSNAGGLTDGDALNDISATTLTISAANDVGTLADPIDTTVTGDIEVKTTVADAPIYLRDAGVPATLDVTVANSDVVLEFAGVARNYTFDVLAIPPTPLTGTLTGTGLGRGITFSNTTGGIEIGALNVGADDIT
ncbi:MAG: hypothetical protein AAB131_17450, partial [Actinomycetota bacterium]